MDSDVLQRVIELRRPWLDDVMLLASALGAGGFVWWVTALITMIFPDKRAAAYRMLLAGLFAWSISEFVVKPAVDRPRPFEVDSSIAVIDAKPPTESFPSGHAAMAFAFALAASRMIPGSAWIWWPLAAVISISRVYIGVHWPSDVLGGAAGGLLAGWFVLGGRAPQAASFFATHPRKQPA